MMATATKTKQSTGAKVDPIAAKLADVKSELQSELIEREVEVDLLVRSIMARTNMLLIGPPGTAKSLVIDQFMSHITDATPFTLLLAKDTPSEQVLGPVSLAALERDEFLRITNGKLPEAHLAFLDEIFKANSTVLNACLKVINERKFDNNGHSMDVPLWALIGASNELPGTDRDDLRAFRDRFGATKLVDHVRTSDGLRNVISGQLERNRGGQVANAHTTLTVAEVEEIQKTTANVDVPSNVIKALGELRVRAEGENLAISVRRLFEGVKLMQAAAVLTGRTEVSTEDMRVFEHILWSDPEDAGVAYNLTLDYAGAVTKRAAKIRGEFEESLHELNELQSEMPTDGSAPEAELMGKIGRVSNILKKIEERVVSGIEDAEEEKHDHGELDQLQADVKASRESVKKLLGIGT
jgi:MoxR-like ATPase